MAVTIDQLNIELTANSQKASSAIDDLIKTMERLKGSLGPLVSTNIKVSNSFNNVTKNTQKASKATDEHANKTNKASKSVKSFTDRLAQQISKSRTLVGAFKSAANTMASWFNESNAYIETLNLFNVTMGDSADGAYAFAESVSNAMGIDIAEWMQYQGTFKNLTAGFGVASEKADIMSQNLTQLSYDLASFFNTDVETAFDKLSSAMSGQVKGLREFGIDTTVASLQEYALSKGIDASVRSMSQAEKSLLRYNYIMEKSIAMQGDMARTIITPANSLRILSAQLTQMKRAMGNVISVIAVQFIPYVQALVQIITDAAKAIASFFGFELPEIDYSGLGGGFSDEFEDAEESLGGVSDSIKKIKKQLMGFDELNIISNPETDSGGGGGASGGGAGFEMDPLEYNFLENLDTSKVDEIKEKFKEILGYVVPIGAALGAWTIASAVVEGIGKIATWLSGIGNITLSAVGIVGFLADIDKFRKYFEDFQANGATFENVAGMISSFAGMLGDAFLLLGKVKTGAALKAIQGVGEVVIAIKSIGDEGANFNNVTTAIQGLSNIGIAIGLFTKNTTLTGASMAIQGLTTVVTELQANWQQIKEGDWSGVDKVTLIIGVVEVLGGLLTALNVFSKLKSAIPTAEATKSVQETTETVTQVGDSMSNMTTKLSTLAKNLGLGLVIIAEVAAAAALIVGTIALLGVELQAVDKAWSPVLKNGENVKTAIITGTTILVAVGVAAKLLGDGGKAVVANLAIGLAMMALLSVNADLFLAEILVIGLLLNQINTAWTPVLENGEPIAAAIALGTTLLIGIGVVAAALGAATVASAGALPLAIGLGTALLVELGVAFVAFCDSLIDVAKKLGDELAPVFDDLNGKLPGLSDDMSDFTSFMTDFCGEVVAYTGVSTIAGIAATIDKVISFFTTDPVQRMSDEVKKQNGQFEDLIVQLEDCIPDMEEAIELVKEYNDLMEEFSEVSGGDQPSLLTFLSDIVTGVWNTIKNVINTIIGGIEKLANGVIGGINGMINALNKIKFTAPDWLPEIGGKTFGFNIGTISTISIPRLAEGGIVGEGQMFIAREAGPELVGTIGNKTAVANNDQIISGIESGVYRAMMAAQASGGSGSQTIRIINEIDGDVVGEKVIAYHNGKVLQTGSTPLLV
jgi:hypothetical protein